MPVPIMYNSDRDLVADQFERIAAQVRNITSNNAAAAPLISLGVIGAHAKNVADTLEAALNSGGVDAAQISSIGDDFAAMAQELHRAQGGRRPR